MAWSDRRDNMGGFNYDIYFATGTLAAIEEKTTQQSLGPRCDAFPSPSQGDVWLDYWLTTPGRTRIAVSDATGRLVATLADEQECSGRHVRIWNGCDVQGNMVSSGVYFIRIQTPEVATTRKVQIVRESRRS